MKYAVGYQLAEGSEEPFSELVRRYSDSIGEVYFPWMDIPTGRSGIATRHGYTDWNALNRLTQDLIEIKKEGKRLDLLLNGNCYGAYAISEKLRNQVISVMDYLEEAVGGVDIVTTASPFIADTIKKHKPYAEVRASVNMWIGSVKAMDYMQDLFDSYYMQREYNRDLERIREFKAWCDENGKGLYLLANSGCLSFCTGHSFHDNLVAHESEICEIANVKDFLPYTCWRYLKNPENRYVVLTNSWIRPEDVHNYEGLISVMKLATRMHSRPSMVIDAYSRESFMGNLLDLFEPGFGRAFEPYVVDNQRLPEDFFKVTSACSRQCHKCGYCRKALNNALIRIEMSDEGTLI